MSSFDRNDSNFLIVRADNGGLLDLFKLLAFNNRESGDKFLESSHAGGVFEEKSMWHGEITSDHRWVIVVSIIVRKIITLFGKPMEWCGYVLEFVLNLLSLNGDFLGLLKNTIHGNIVMPKRDSETFISAIGHLDGRIDLFKTESFSEELSNFENIIQQQEKTGNRGLMDLCMMASKLAYENVKVVRNVVTLHWKMHFVDFYNCWNDYQKDDSTQVFIMCDKPEDANLIIVSFRGTEPFDADDWITDFDYSWYEIPKLGKVHMGFLEALGLGNRSNTITFQEHLLRPRNISDKNESSPSQDSPVMKEMTAYYAVRNKLKHLLKEHTNANFIVTGHSLGGALAILLPTVLLLHEETEIMKRLLSVYTFGQPRIGDRQLGKFMEARLEHPETKYFRIVYCNDLVPRLPYDDKTFLYKHFGICLYYNSLYIEQKRDEEPNRNYFGLRYLVPEYLNAVWELLRSFIMKYVYGPEYKECWEGFVLRFVGLVIPGLSAHSPVDYVNSIRLGRKRSPEMVSLQRKKKMEV